MSTTKKPLQEVGLSAEGHQVPPKLWCFSSCLLLARSTGHEGDLLVGNKVAAAFQGAGRVYSLKPISEWALRSSRKHGTVQ